MTRLENELTTSLNNEKAWLSTRQKVSRNFYAASHVIGKCMIMLKLVISNEAGKVTKVSQS